MKNQKKHTLANAVINKTYTIIQFEAKTLVEKRLCDLGFVRGTRVSVVGKSFFDLTIAVCIRNSIICIKKQNADRIFVREI